MIQLLLYKGKWTSPVSAAVMLWTRSRYSHSALVLNREDVWEFTRWGFNKMKLEDYEGEYELWNLRDMTPEREELIRNELQKLMDQEESQHIPYDHFAVAGVVLKTLFAYVARALKLPLVTGNPLNCPGRFFCSEFVSRFVAPAGYLHKKSHSEVFPCDHVARPWAERLD